MKYHRSLSVFCDLCPRSFTKKYLLRVHMTQDHLKLRTFDCSVCSRKLPFKGNLKSHMLRHGEKTACIICHKFVSNMRQHMTNHVEVKWSICNIICTKNSLSRHVMRAHCKRKWTMSVGKVSLRILKLRQNFVVTWKSWNKNKIWIHFFRRFYAEGVIMDECKLECSGIKFGYSL